MKSRAARGRLTAAALLAVLGLALGGRPPARAEAPAFKIEEKRAEMGAPPAGLAWAGAARVDITPTDTGTYIAGFMPNRTARGVHDRLYARCLYLDDGRTPLAFVTLDLLGFLNPQVQAMRAQLTDRFGPNVTVSATHSHSGPDPIGLWGFGFVVPFGSGRSDDYMDRVVNAGAQCVREAMETAIPARAIFAETTAPADLSTNFHEPERPGVAASKDDQVAVVHWEAPSGRSVATVLNYACHVEALHQENRLFTADFAGFLARELERRFGGVGLFMNGAIGGLIVPNIPRETPTEERYALAEQMGSRLAATARRAIREAGVRWAPSEGDGFRIAHHPFQVKLGNWFFDFYHKVGLLDLEASEDAEARKLVSTEVTAIAIGPSVWLTVPGEIFPSLGNAYKPMMKSRFPFLVGLGNDELGYIMTEAEFQDSLYSYEQSMSVSERMGPALTEAVAAALAALHGEPPKEGTNANAAPAL